MTSLEFIMDMNDEEDPQINKNDDGSNPPGPSRSQDPSRAATSSYEQQPRDQDDRLTSAPTRRRGPTGRSSKSTATSSPSTSSARPALVSRRSTTSSESMDPVGYGGPAQGSSSGGGAGTAAAGGSMPTRPLGNVQGEGGLPVKYTPITGRVSRAKKGVPVHTCDLCKPPKTFTRAEHLRRHQLGHKSPGYTCTFPGCGKPFHRADLLARHSQKHEHDDKASSRGTGGEVSRPASAASLEEGASGLTYMSHNHSSMGGGSGTRASMSGPSDMSSGSTYPGNLSSYQPMGSQGSSSSRQTPMSPPQHSGRGESYQPTSNPSSQGYVLTSQPPTSLISQPLSIGDSPVTGTEYPFAMDYHQPRTSPSFSIFMDNAMLPQTLPSLTIPDNSISPGLVHPSHDGSPWPSSASDSNYSTPSDIGHRRNMNRSFESPTSDWPGSGIYSGASHNLQSPSGGLDTFFGAAPNLDQALSLTPFSDDHAFVEQPQQYHPYSSVRSPTPPTISLSAQSTENLVTLAAPSISDAASAGTRQKGSALLLGTLGSTAFLTANTLPPHVRNAIPRYLEVYWKHFDPLFPLVHRESAVTPADEVLRCAMAAVGAQYLQGKDDRVRANELHEFAWKEVKTCTQWNLQVMQAIILCEFYARFRGRSVQRSPSEAFQSLYSRMADHQTPDNFAFSTSTLDERWNEWIDNESRRRLMAACFVLDVHASVYYQQHVIQPFPMSTHPIPLIRPTEDLWAARSSEAWKVLLENARLANAGPSTHAGDAPTAEQISNAPYLDRAVFLTSEVLRLPKRSSPPILDLSVEIDPNLAERIDGLFPGSAVGNTYLALHHTPLHDLLAVSGDTWLFSKKVASHQVFQQHKRRLQLWCGSPHAGAAAGFAAKALLAFLDNISYSNHNRRHAAVSSLEPEEEGGESRGRSKSWNMLDISDYWAVYVCALICWALGHRSIVRGNGAYSGSGPDYASHDQQQQYYNRHYDNDSGNNNKKSNANAGERETMKWLRMVAGLGAEQALGARSRKETMGVVSMVRRRLEDEAVGVKSRLLVDALWTLKRLEERAGDKWF